MNYYSIEFFKHYLRKAINAKNNKEDKLLNEVFKSDAIIIREKIRDDFSVFFFMVK
jgi:hypothetical protein